MTKAISRASKTLAFVILGGLISTGCASHQITPPRTAEQKAKADREDFEIDVIKGITYVERDGNTSTQGDLYVPKDAGPFPGVLVVHGGNWSARDRSDMEGISKKISSRGFVAFNIDYRLVPASLFPAQLQDCQAAIRWMRANAGTHKIRPEKIGAFGYSAGGHLVSLLATTDPEAGFDISSRIQAVVSGGTPADLTYAPDSPIVERFLGKTFAEAPELFKKASPVHQVTPDDPPVFLYHGKGDQVVHLEHSKRFAAALEKTGIAHETYFIPILGHVPVFLLNKRSVNKGIDFLEVHLK